MTSFEQRTKIAPDYKRYYYLEFTSWPILYVAIDSSVASMARSDDVGQEPFLPFSLFLLPSFSFLQMRLLTQEVERHVEALVVIHLTPFLSCAIFQIKFKSKRLQIC